VKEASRACKCRSENKTLRFGRRHVPVKAIALWTNAGFILQSTPAVTGPFTNLPTAKSPYTNALIGPQQFFRLKGD
jgi:hypothetical protein